MLIFSFPFSQSNVHWFQISVSHRIKQLTQQRTAFKLDVIRIIRALDVNKAHGHDNISVWTIRLCASTAVITLTLTFLNSVTAGTFATEWKKALIVPIHKK